MNRLILGRLVWKEYRQYRALLIVALLIGVAAIGLVAFAAQWTGRPRSSETLLQIALAVPILYAIGCAPTTFAVERDLETIEFLRSLPQPPGLVATAKIGYALASTVALAVVIGGFGCLLRQDDASPMLEWRNWPTLSIGALEVTAWGLFFSLWLRQPLWAVVAAAFASLAVGFAVVAPLSDPLRLGDGASLAGVRLALVGGLLTIDLAWGARWLRGGTERAHRRERRDASAAPATGAATTPIGRSWSELGRFIWQAWRQSRGLALMTIAGYFAVVIFFVLLGLWSRTERDLHQIAWLLFPAFAAIAGCCVFLLDQQRQQYRFHAELGASPRLLWVSRHAFWGSVVLLVGALALAILACGEWYSTPPWKPTSGGGVWSERTDVRVNVSLLDRFWLCGVLAASAYATGQLCSLFFRSGVIGLFLGLTASVIAGSWIGILEHLAIPRSVSALPWIVGACWASWYRAPAWLAERDGRAGWTRPCSITAAALVGSLAAVAAYRVVEIPRVAADQRPDAARPKSDVLSYAAPYVDAVELATARETGGAYLAASELARNWPWHKKRRGELPSPLQQFLTATGGPTCRFEFVSTRAGTGHLQRLVDLASRLAELGRAAEQAGDAETSRDYDMACLRFSRHLWQSGEIEAGPAAAKIEEESMNRLLAWAARQTNPDDVGRLRRDVAWSREAMLSGERLAFATVREQFSALLDADDVGSSAYDAPEAASRRVLRWLPWERWRWERIAAYARTAQWNGLRRMTSVRDGWELTARQADAREGLDEVRDWASRSVPWPYAGVRIDAWSERLVRQRGLEVRLALLQWRLVHGDWPTSLLELSAAAGQGESLAKDDCQLFWFQRAGSSLPLEIRSDSTPQSTSLPPSTPFLWWQSQVPRGMSDSPRPAAGTDGGERLIAPARAASPPPTLPAVYERSFWESGLILPLEWPREE